MAPIQIAAGRFRRAVATGSHQQTLARAEEYGRAVQEALRRFGRGDPRMRRTAREALDLLEWARRVALSRRALCAAHLSELPDLRPYGMPIAASHTWKIEA